MREFRGPHLRLRALIIGARGVGALQRVGRREAVERLVRSLIGDFEGLARRQSDGARERQLVFGDLVLQRQKLLLLGFQFHLRTKLVDGGRSSGAMLIAGAFIESLRGFHLHAGRIDAGGGGDNLQDTLRQRPAPPDRAHPWRKAPLHAGFLCRIAMLSARARRRR